MIEAIQTTLALSIEPRVLVAALLHALLVGLWVARYSPASAENVTPAPDEDGEDVSFMRGVREGAGSGIGQYLHGWWMCTAALLVMLPALVPSTAPLSGVEWFGVTVRTAAGVAAGGLIVAIVVHQIPLVVYGALAGGYAAGGDHYAAVGGVGPVESVRFMALAIGLAISLVAAVLVTTAMTVWGSAVARAKHDRNWADEPLSRPTVFISAALNVLLGGYLPCLWYVAATRS